MRVPEPTSPDQGRSPGAGVLVACADPAVAGPCCRALREYGFVTATASTAEQTLDLLRSEPVSVVLLDVALGGAGALAVAHALGVRGAGPSLLVMAGRDEWGIAAEMLARGALGWLGREPGVAAVVPHIVKRALAYGDALRRLEAGEEERAELRGQVRAAQKMEEIGVIAAGIAHDFGNMLTAIHGHSTLAQGSVEEGSQVWQNLEQVRRASERAAILTRQLLSLSRRRPAERVAADLGDIVRGMENLLVHMAGESVSVSLDLGPAVPVVLADPGGMEQILMNLVVNARDAMPCGGAIVIGTSACPMGDSGDDGVTGAALSVTDTGTGMDRNTIERIFDPFFTTKPEGRGTGLGLAVVKGIVREHDGSIEVRSEPGAGTTFVVRLAAGQDGEDEKGADPLEQAWPRGNGETILVAEDDEDMRGWCATALGAFGYRVLTACGAGEAAAIFAEHVDEVRLLLADVVLADGSGLDLGNEFVGQRPELRLLFCSGYGGERSMAGEIREMGYGFLAKPFTMELLLTAVDGALRGRRRERVAPK